MENPNIVRNGGIKLPIGYRFRPTDEELVVHYLTRKANSLPFPAQVIPELNVFQTNPTQLPGDSTEKRFFFWKRKGKWRKSRGMTESGYWKPMGKEKHVVSFESNRGIGVKKTFAFYEGGLRTEWVMREYRLLGSQTGPVNSGKKYVREMKDWVVCKIYQKKRKPKKKKKNVVETTSDMISYSKKIWKVRDTTIVRDRDMVIVEETKDDELGPPQPSSSSSSFCGEAAAAAAAGDEEEITSAYYVH